MDSWMYERKEQGIGEGRRNDGRKEKEMEVALKKVGGGMVWWLGVNC